MVFDKNTPHIFFAGTSMVWGNSMIKIQRFWQKKIKDLCQKRLISSKNLDDMSSNKKRETNKSVHFMKLRKKLKVLLMPNLY